jgi:RNA processing factor Prp31
VSARAIHDKYKPERVENYDKLFKQEAEIAIKTLSSVKSYLNLVQESIKNFKPIKTPEFKEIVDNHKTLFV